MTNAADKPVVAVIAAGGMGSAVGARLSESGVRVLTSLKGRSAASAKRAADAGMQDASDAEITGADFVLSIVPPGEALALARRLQPALRAANRKPVYVECNAVSPQTVDTIAAVVAEADCPFVDGGIIGPPPRPGVDRTKIYVSGPGSGRVDSLNQHGLRIRAMGGKVGDASALKMAYGGLNKGLIALGSALVLAAERAGVGDVLRAELAESQVPVLAQLSRGVPDMFAKSYRWVAEFDEIARFAGPGSETEIFDGIAKLYDRIARDFEGPKAETGALARFFEKATSREK
jgi:3-hydroxyisobutyrate dehydrogenase-like beta-hydroxyacid dehydrogenase